MTTLSASSSDWAFITGKWEKTEAGLEYSGPRQQDDSIPHGIALSDISSSGGDLSVVVKFETNLDKGDAIQILLGYNAATGEYYSAGIGGYGYAYVINRYNPARGWSGLFVKGDIANIKSGEEYRLKVRIDGQKIRLLVNGVRVLENNLPTPLPGTQTGLFAWGRTKVLFSSFEVLTARPKAFVVMQFSVFLGFFLNN
ncbi:MAG: hypothetical protein HYZ11_12990 [Candidatus Tectomicrobia bacterium]|uniref:3-keto-disaccharide hydrolase domain-containing protein n=1 Tax=Tectimicrobiota bacterium TaxID=2528274 RepID=A0A932MMP5_UNCTE|nr:hypothetical protein [Candidatus Tectomicrobia bacterium]